MPSLGNIDFNGSTAGQNLNITQAGHLKFQNSKMVDEGLSGSLDWHEQSFHLTRVGGN